MLRLALIVLLATGPSSDRLAPQPQAPVRDVRDLRLASLGSGQSRPSTVQGLSLSADGSVLAFASDAGDLVGGADGPASDVFRRDLATGTTELVSVTLTGAPTARPSLQPSLSANGRVLAFTSFAAHLTADDDGGFGDIFVQDGRGAALSRISGRADGGSAHGTSEQPSLSADGRFVAFQSWADDLVPGDGNGHADILLHDRLNGATRLVSARPDGLAANGDSSHPVLSGDGSRLAFVSRATDLVPGSPPGQHVFMADLTSGRIVPLDRAPDGAPADHGPGPRPGLALSYDGSVVAFVSQATNLIPGLRGAPLARVHLTDLATGAGLRVDTAAELGGLPGGHSGAPSLSADGRLLAFTSVVAPPFEEVLVLDRLTGSVRRFSLGGSPADQLAPVLSASSSHLALIATGELELPGAHDGHDAVVVAL